MPPGCRLGVPVPTGSPSGPPEGRRRRKLGPEASLLMSNCRGRQGLLRGGRGPINVCASRLWAQRKLCSFSAGRSACFMPENGKRQNHHVSPLGSACPTTARCSVQLESPYEGLGWGMVNSLSSHLSMHSEPSRIYEGFPSALCGSLRHRGCPGRCGGLGLAPTHSVPGAPPGASTTEVCTHPPVSPGGRVALSESHWRRQAGEQS